MKVFFGLLLFFLGLAKLGLRLDSTHKALLYERSRMFLILSIC